MQALILAVALAAAPATPPAVAAAVPAAPVADANGAIPALDTVLVRGVQPGPRLWRVDGQPGHTLWILGTLSPLPKDVSWQPAEVNDLLTRAGVVLAPPRASIRIGAGGALKVMTLLPTVRKSVQNADGKDLRGVLPADLHARWAEAKRTHGVTDRKIDGYTPSMAALQLHLRAVEHAGLVRGNITETVLAAAKKQKVPVRQTGVEFKFDVDRGKLKGGLRELGGRPPDVECLRATLDQLDAQLATMRTRANAWAKGDLDVLRRVVAGELESPCRKFEQDAMSTLLERPGLEAEVAAGWVKAAQEALAQHAVSLAIVPIESLVNDARYLARLQALGLVVHEPDAPEPDEAEADEALARDPAG